MLRGPYDRGPDSVCHRGYMIDASGQLRQRDQPLSEEAEFGLILKGGAGYG